MTTIAPNPPSDVDEALTGLEQRAAELQGEFETLPIPVRLERLAEIEGALAELECARAEGQDRAQEHPILPVTLGWVERLRRIGSLDAAQAAEGLGAEMLILGLRQRERRGIDALEALDGEHHGPKALGPKVRDGLFDSLLAVEELRQRVEGRAERLGPAAEADAKAVCDEAIRVQRVLREGLERACAILPPDSPTRSGWVGRLVDLADETILSASERGPRVAARLLGESRRAIRWHLGAIETTRGNGKRRLKRRLRRLQAERVEQILQAELERTFGRRRVELWERTVLVAILGVVGLLIYSFVRGPSPWILALDTAICGFLLWDFFVKAYLVRFNGTWLKRHVLTDLIPALPFAWFATLEVATDTGRMTRLLRLLRVGQLAKSLRIALPLIRMFRATSFLVRGLDRLVRRNARLLMVEVLLFPTQEERQRARETERSGELRLWVLRGEVDGYYERLLDEKDDAVRESVAECRLNVLQRASRIPVATTDARPDPRAVRTRSLPMAEDLVHRLSSIRSEEVEGRIGEEAVRRIARGARLIARSPLRLAPILGRWAPLDAADLPDRRVASRTIRTVSRSFATLHHRILWWADLRGTLTPGELVGRVGSTLVARTARPAMRLLMLGGAFLVLAAILQILGLDPDQEGPASGMAALIQKVHNGIRALIRGVLVPIGAVCMAFMAFGIWLQRLARDTTTFHEQVAHAQFLHLTDSIKARQRHADAALLARRVFRPERNLFERDGAREATERDEARFVRHLEQFLSEGVSPPSMDQGFDPVARSVMLYRDLLDGALLAHSDTRATSQLLGNLAIQRMLEHAGRVNKTTRKSLMRIDLERRRTFLSGPYLWFHSISRAMSSRAARLIVDYNAHAIPVTEIERAGEPERERYEAWLVRSLGGEAPAQSTSPEEPETVEASAVGKAPQLTTAFTVLHFLDDAPARDAEVAKRFGVPVLERLRQDRRALVRTVFGTYPLHRLPLESRILNLRALYAEWVEGGKVLLVPLRLLGIGARLTVLGIKAVARAVAAIRKPDLAFQDVKDAEADFHAAARKIGRMRGPGALAAAELRAILDPEYHGLALPFGLHDSEEHDSRTLTPAEADAGFLGADPAFHDQLAAFQARAARAIRHLEKAKEGGLLDRLAAHLGLDIEGDVQTLRALTILVAGDDDGLRSGLFGREVVGECTVDALEFGLPRAGLIPPVGLWIAFQRFWRNGGKAFLMEAAGNSGAVRLTPADGIDGDAKELRTQAERQVKRAAWRVLWADLDGCRAAFRQVLKCRTDEEQAAARLTCEERLGEALRHPARVTEQLITLRAVQTMTLVDVRNYRRHVWSLGQYGDEGDSGDILLDLPE